MTGPKRIIYQCAGNWGIPFGLYLSCAALSSIFTDWFAPLSLVFILLFLGTPVLTYAFQRRKFIEDDGFTEYAGLWMLGIMLYILGTIISSLVVYLVLKYVRPDFMVEQVQHFIDIFGQRPEMRDSEIISNLQLMVNKGLTPTPIQMVFSAFWFITFGGSLVSALTALFAQRPLHKRR